MNINFECALSLNKIPGVVHGFFTRHGGASTGALSSLNCCFLRAGESHANVEKNRARAMTSLGLNGFKLVVPNLAHASNSLLIDDNSDFSAIGNFKADAVITSKSGIALGITYADCLPILVSSEDGDVVGAIHAGWRGIKCNVIKRTIDVIRKNYGPKLLMAAVGPAISQIGFSVTDEVLDFFLEQWPSHVQRDDQYGKVDLTGIAMSQLHEAGINQIEKVGGFTDLRPECYFSHRRDKGKTGRHIAIIAKISAERI